MKKLNKKQINKLKKYWRILKILEDSFLESVGDLEKAMSEELNIEDLEFFFCDGYCGIGDVRRTIKLVNSYELN